MEMRCENSNDYNKCGIPTMEEATSILREAQMINPGPWVQHSIHAGKAAETIAKNCEDLNPNFAFSLGLLHDIGVRYGMNYMKHILHGYNFAMEKGYHKLAKICLTHSFDCHNIKACFGKLDCFTEEEYDFIKEYIETTTYDDYDRLIQLCDALALPNGICLMEKRIMDITLQNGINEHITEKWKAAFENKRYFEKKIGKSIYSILPGVVENTFEEFDFN